jgi:hypothetical protein
MRTGGQKKRLKKPTGEEEKPVYEASETDPFHSH